MEDILAPLITFILVIASSVIKSHRDKGNEQTKKVTTTRKTINSQSKQSSNTKFERVGDKKKEPEKKQLANLQKELNRFSQQSDDFSQRKLKQSENDLERLKVSQTANHVTKKDHLDVKKHLTRNNLARTIVMSEVLGQPRSKKPYRMLNR